jgi:hypothetical protein
MDTISLLDYSDVGLEEDEEGFLSIFEQSQIRASFAEFLGLPEAWIISLPFTSFQPIPVPPRQDEMGKGKLPKGLNPVAAGHPVWWLDAASKVKDPEETELEYALRLWCEIQDRGLEVDDGPVDVLRLYLDWDVKDPEVQAKVKRYIAGEYVAELNGLEIGPRTEPDDETDDVFNRDDQKVAVKTFLAPRMEILRRASERARATNMFLVEDRSIGLRAFEEKFAQAYDQVGVKATLLQSAAQRQVPAMELLDMRHELRQALEALMTFLCEHYVDAETVVLATVIEGFDANRYEAFRDRLKAETDAMEARYEAESAAPIARVYDDPSDPTGYQMLQEAIDAWHVDAGADTEKVLVAGEHYLAEASKGPEREAEPETRPITATDIADVHAWMAGTSEGKRAPTKPTVDLSQAFLPKPGPQGEAV